MDIKQKLLKGALEVLTSREAMSINFTAYIPIVGKMVYPVIAAEMLIGKREVFADNLTKDVSGAYSIEYDIIFFKENSNTNSREWKATVIHEATHAWTDRMKVTGIGLYENEAIAYIAEHIYMRKVGMSFGISKHPFHNTARKIANAIIAGKPMPLELINKLSRQVGATPHFQHIQKKWNDDGGFNLDG